MTAHALYRPRPVNSRRFDESSSIIVVAACRETRTPSPLKNDLLRDASRLRATIEQRLIAARISENQVDSFAGR
jgi:hypothetical protein